MKNFIAVFLIICFFFSAKGQQLTKKTMDKNVYAIWNTVQQPTISNDGDWVVYHLRPGEGDTHLKIFHTPTQREYSFDRGSNAKISDDSKFVVFTIKPAEARIKMMKRQKVKKKDLPKDSLGIYDLENRSLVKIPNVKSFQLPKKWNGYVAFLREAKMFERTDSTTIRPKKKESKENGTQLTLRALKSGTEETFYYVKNYTLSEEGNKMMFSSTGNDSTFLAGAYLYDFNKKALQPLHQQKGAYKKMTFDEKGNQAAFLANVDTTDARVAPYQLYFWSGNAQPAEMILSNKNPLQKDWRLSENGRLNFSENGKRLFFGIAPMPILQDTSILDEEIVDVEVWSYTDKVLYTQQESQLDEEKKRTYLAVYEIGQKRLQQLGNLTVDQVRIGAEGNANIVLGYNEKPYLKRLSWEGGPSYKDFYIKELGQKDWKMFAKEIRATPRLSPDAKYVYWYSTPDTAYFTYSLTSQKITQVTNNKLSKFYDEINDRPMHPSSYRMAGWTEDDQYMLIYDRYDIWKIHPEYKEQPERLTKGRESNWKTVFRYIRLDPEERSIDMNEMFVHFFNETNKHSGYGKINYDTKSKTWKLSRMDGGEYSFSRRPQLSKNKKTLLYTKENFQVFPDLRAYVNPTSNGWFKDDIKISKANPQQSDYKWGTIEPYTWTSLDGQKLNGMLVKPEGFDPNKKYPMIVNFYEKSSNTIHRHRAPYPHRSTINYAYYSNRGYLIFNPDVPYRIGYPGESAYNAVIPGVTSLIEKGFVDEKNIGVQGHSWGGYQIAYLVTKSNIFKCAESGAPVVNMISAYGGIRWGSGMSRMFQYEHTQSRIGGTLWDYPVRYIENSPIFFADKIETPILIMHNDMDSAVPWEQGIEFFVALRRLGKPAWMLTYNGEPHWPLKLQNRKDFNLRMEQFFDHYLQGGKKPRWMQRGVPAMEKGILQGY